MQDLPYEEAQCISQLHFGLDEMEAYYVSFKGKRYITAEAQFEVKSLKDGFPNIYNQIGIRDWGPFTMPIGPDFPELVWEIYASYRARKSTLKNEGRVDTMPCLLSVWWTTSKGMIHRHDRKFEARMWLDLVCARLSLQRIQRRSSFKSQFLGPASCIRHIST
ncbi:hypothetical protein HAX54_021682 [Datura stramonium]|uniref:Uncharacterized protein n=1 Tax=Datura stramonium TaxID=4076 RepID=A0ABS8S423_DATST|nr:hypothetical protein [Datura stramonium]